MYLSILFLQHLPNDCPGCFWLWFFWMLAAFALGLGIGRWIWGKYALLVKDKNEKLKAFKDKNEALEKDFIALKYQINESEKDNKGLKASLSDLETNIVVLSTQLSKLRQENRKEKNVEKSTKEALVPPTINPGPNVIETLNVVDSEEITEEKIIIPAADSPTAESSSNINKEKENTTEQRSNFSTSTSSFLNYESYLKNNNLKIIEGVGPKIEGILNKAGYITWKDLANADSNTLQNIMHDAGPRYRIHSPRTWQKQIQLCLEKNWQGLIDYQQKLYSEKTNQDIPHVLTKIEKVITKKLGFVDLAVNNLKMVEGIGPKIESLLKMGHINNWEALAEAPLERIEKILEDGGDRFKLAIPSSWSIQAQYAINHDWVKLKQYQEELTNGQS